MEGKLKKIPSQSRIASHKKTIVKLSAITLLLIVGLFIYDYLKNKQGYTGNEKSIAVLPFINMSNDAEQEYFSDGITQEIINQISKIKDMDIRAWNSVVQLKNSGKSYKEKAAELNVLWLLTGSVQKAGNRVRIHVELADANTGKRLWGDDYDKDWGDVFSIQSDIAQRIAAQLNARLTSDEKRIINIKPTNNPKAYELYRKGRSFWDLRTPVSHDSAEAYYSRAIQLDPEFAPAYSGLADSYSLGHRGLSRLEAVPIARAYANKALSLDSTLSEALTTLGFIQQNFDYNWNQSKKDLEKAIAFNPNYPLAHMYYGNVLQYTGEKERGLREAEKAVELDPLSHQPNWVLGRNYYFAGKYDAAIKQFQKTASLTKNQKHHDVINWSLGLVYLEKKLYSQAQEIFDRLRPDYAYNVDINQILQSYGYAIMGNKIKAEALLEKSLKEVPDQSPYRLAQAYVALENFNKAMNQLDKGYESRDLHMFWLKVDPAFNPLRNELRFKALMKKMNFE